MARQRGRNTGCLYKRHGKGSYIARWYDATGKRCQKSTRTIDLATARRILAKHVEGVALRKSGVVDARADRFAIENQRPLADHVRDYLEHCTGAGLAPKHIDEKTRHLNRMRDGTKATQLSELTADALEKHLWRMQSDGLSARTVNFARQTAVAFMSWCVKTGRVEANVLKVVPKLDERKDRRRVRRPLTDSELARLLDVAELHGRKAWYLAAALAGLRRGDLKRLTWADVNFAESSITITEGKAKRTDIIPMHPQLAEELRRRLDANPALPTASVFAQAVTPLTVLKDLLRAGLAREEPMSDANGKPIMVGKQNPRPKMHIVTSDAEGRVLDLHSLRTTLGTNLARSGVAPQLAQRIMRHADYRTTLQHYTVLGLADTASAIGKLSPISSGQEREAARATGTDVAQGIRHKGCSPKCRQLGLEMGQNAANDCEDTDTRRHSSGVRKTLKTKAQSDILRGKTKGDETAGDATRTRNIQLGRLVLYH